LTDPAVATEAIAPLFASDVIVSENSQVVATGKAAWLRWRQAERKSYHGRTIGFSSASANEHEAGSLLVLDSFDTIDTANLPPGIVMDARLSTRSTLYRFGNDHLIHRVEMAKVSGFWTSTPPLRLSVNRPPSAQ